MFIVGPYERNIKRPVWLLPYKAHLSTLEVEKPELFYVYYTLNTSSFKMLGK